MIGQPIEEYQIKNHGSARANYLNILIIFEYLVGGRPGRANQINEQEITKNEPLRTSRTKNEQHFMSKF